MRVLLSSARRHQNFLPSVFAGGTPCPVTQTSNFFATGGVSLKKLQAVVNRCERLRLPKVDQKTKFDVMGSSSSEEAAELVATIRGQHVVMKKWFNEDPSEEAAALRKKYGAYPGLWKEVLNWVGWKESRKAYLKHTQGATSTSASEKKSTEQPLPRKRRSRWGASDNSSSDAASKKRRSRWGKEESSNKSSNSSASSVPGHYGPSSGPRPPTGLLGLGLPGMPTNLTPEQKVEMGKLQSKLRDINVKLDNLETEAARVDALPRGHRERSPSPPPSKCSSLPACFR